MLEQQPQERRLVTVLFADFAGFTELADQMDPEELQVLVSGIFEDLAEEAIRHDGTIEKFIGDAIFVVFGAPVAHEDDPQRALRTALAMQRVFADHAARVKKERGVEFGLRIGIHTGMVVAGAVRSVAEYGVMGDTVNIASRLQSVAGPAEIYVTQTTFRLTNREFSFREVGPIELKGKDKPILAYALIGERTDVRPSIEIAAPLVGRWMELSRLDLAYQSARLGRTEVVLIAGEPGIGKSRLASEFIGLATAAEEGSKAADAPRVMRWTFSRVNQRSYAGFIEPILVELSVQPTDVDGVTRVGEKLQELGFANPLMIAPTLAQFLHLPGVSEPASDSEEWKRAMYIVVYDVIAALARQHPLLYVLEDLHFADAASLDLLWFLASRASRVPILFLLAQRLGPGSPEPKPSRTNFTQLVLEPLSDEEAARIVEATLDWIPDELRDRIVARAGGNPFFIEESLRSLVESGAAEKDASGEWHLRERPAALEVPATLHAVVASRIDRLPPTARECIQLAAVIGQRFGDRVLREAGGDRIADAVDQLIAADLVLEAVPGERREGRYRFKHAVVQEVAYNTLLVRRRIELHRRVAAAYEAVLGEELKEFYPALAHHYLIGEVPEKAAEYSWKSAQRATDRRGGRGALPDRARAALPGRERRGALGLRASARAARSARSEERRGRDPAGAHGGALHAVGREVSGSRRAHRTRPRHRGDRALARARAAPRREVVHAAARAQVDGRRLGGVARDRERGARHRGGARPLARALAVPRRGGLRLSRARQLPRGVSREPATAAHREIAAGQRRAHRRAHDGRAGGALPRRHERGHGARR
ncbi:MAG: hypothetical protein E6I19_02680 [Chloroflexi bacterium]|nr:MAG: hypothetical protein E6I19_02680 [Chloroflexota bacterium]